MENSLITINNDKALLVTNIINELQLLDLKIKSLKEIQDSIKKSIKEEMEAKGITKIMDEESGMSITYTEAKNDIEVFNKEKLREEMPEVYDEYSSMTGKKSAFISVRFK